MSGGIIKTRTEFKQYVKNSDKNLVFYFGATWCGPCKKAKTIVAKELKDYVGEYIYMDYDESSDVASYMRIQSIPTLLGYKNKEHHATCVSSNEHDIKKFFNEMK